MVKGVSKSGNKFCSSVVHKGIRYYLGTFNTEEEASQAYIHKKEELQTHIPKTIQDKFIYKEGYLYNKKSGLKYTKTNNNGYVTVSLDYKVLLAHRVIWELLHGEIPSNMVIDHIDRDRNNNLIENLRIVSCQQNLYNSEARNIQGMPKGVSIRNSGRYQARIHHNYKNIYLGTYDTIEEAAEAYNIKAIELSGGYAYTNPP